jgi:hypothetical protein
MHDRLPILSERIERAAAAYAAEPGTIAYAFAAQRDAIAAGVEAAARTPVWSQQGDYAVEARS